MKTLNQDINSLWKMARRQYKGILSSGFKNKYLDLLILYLEKQMHRLQNHLLDNEEKNILLRELETTDAAIRQYSISFPVNEALYIPQNLNSDQKNLLRHILITTEKEKRHLKIA